MKQFGLDWVFEPFEDDPTFYSKKMFGGLAAYVHHRMVMVLTESPGEREYRGKKFPFDIWNGIMFPTEREFHAELQEEFKSLIPHPVLGKWLYLPMKAEDFEEATEKIAKLISKNDPKFGVYPKEKKSAKKKAY